MNITSIKSKAQNLLDNNRPAEAKALYTQVCSTVPDDIDAWHMLGAINGMLGLFEEAETCARRVIKLNPAAVPAYNNLGAALLAQDKVSLAKAEFDTANKLDPDNHQTLCNLGNISIHEGNFPAACKYYKKAIKLKHDYADAHSNLGNALLCMHKPRDAMQSLETALGYNPEHPDYIYHYARTLQSLKRVQEALDAYNHALKLNPGMTNALHGIGELCKEQGEYTQALQYYMRALETSQDNARALGAIAGIKKDSGEISDAIKYYQQAIKIDPDVPGLYSNYFLTLNYIDQHDDLNTADLYRSWDKTLENSSTGTFAFDATHDRKRLVIGYVSHDFRKHSVAYFFEPLISHHDKNDFHIICYSTMGQHLDDDTTRRIANKADQWRDITYITDHDVAEMIYKDKVDILVDLSGHTAWNRLGIFSRRPAPVQVTYLGYPNTTGLSAIDYRITDAVADPADEDASGFTEQLLRLPHLFLTYQPPSESPAICKPPCLVNNYITFGSFNALPKITNGVLECWCSLLGRVENSRIILKNGSLVDRSVKKRILDYFSSSNISADRVKLLSQVPDYSAHMGLYNQVDIALDTFPYNGTTTTCEALWMGVPVVTLAGQRHAGRVSSSILHEIGMDEFIASSTDRYIEIAADFSKDAPGITDHRLKMRNRISMSILGDHKAFTQNLEHSYKDIWNRYISSSQNKKNA